MRKIILEILICMLLISISIISLLIISGEESEFNISITTENYNKKFENLEPLWVSQEDLKRPTEPGGGLDEPVHLQHILPRIYNSPSGYFSIHYTNGFDENCIPADAVPLSFTNPSGHPDYIFYLGEILDVAAAKMIDQGYNIPPTYYPIKPNDEWNSNPDDRYDVFVYNTYKQPNYDFGFCRAEQYPNTPSYSHIHIDNDLDNFLVPPNPPLWKLIFTSTHEYFHAIQYTYDCTELDWWKEATASWIAGYINPSYDTIYINYYLHHFFDYPERSLDSNDGLHTYAAMIFAKYLVDYLDFQGNPNPGVIIREIWEKCVNLDADLSDNSAINFVLTNNYGTTLKEIFKNFAWKNLCRNYANAQDWEEDVNINNRLYLFYDEDIVQDSYRLEDTFSTDYTNIFVDNYHKCVIVKFIQDEIESGFKPMLVFQYPSGVYDQTPEYFNFDSNTNTFEEIIINNPNSYKNITLVAPRTGDGDGRYEVVVGSPCKVLIDNVNFNIPNGQTRTHHIKVKNNLIPEDKLPITLKTKITSGSGWIVEDNVNGKVLDDLLPGEESQEFTISITNNNAILDIDIEITAEPNCDCNCLCRYELYNGKDLDDGHLSDHPDDSYSISDSSYPTPWLIDTRSDIGILYTGWGRGIGHLLSNYNIGTALVKPDLTLLNELQKNLNDLKVLIIGSAGLTGYDNSPVFRSKLADFVDQGGTIITFTSQHGYEFNALPSGQVDGYGWSEDISCHHASIGINTYHPILSSLNTIVSNASVDGYFTSYPENTTILFSRTKNSQPAMIMYPYGNGTVIVSTLYTDWAYGHSQATMDAINLIRDTITWAIKPTEIPDYAAGDSIVIPVNITNNRNTVTDNIRFRVIDPDKNFISYIDLPNSIIPSETVKINFTYTAPSTLGIWTIDVLLQNDSNVTQTDLNILRFAVSKYTKNPDGFIYHKQEITFSVNSERERYPGLCNATFTITIWNNGDTDEEVTFWWVFPHHWRKTRNPIYGRNLPTAMGIQAGHYSNLYQTLLVPANGEASFQYIVPLKSIAWIDRLWADFYRGDSTSYDYLGRSSRGFFIYEPKVNVQVETDKNSYTKEETVSITVNLFNQQPYNYESIVTVEIFEFYKNKIFSESFNVTLNYYEPIENTINFPLSNTRNYGSYSVKVIVRSDGYIIGYVNDYFKFIKKYDLNVNFERPEKEFKANENMAFDLEIINIAGEYWDSNIKISIPTIGYINYFYVTLNANQTGLFNINVLLPETILPGKHTVYIYMEKFNDTIEECFFIPYSKLILDMVDNSFYNGDMVNILLTNTGGVRTNYNCNVFFIDYRRGFTLIEKTYYNYLNANDSTFLSFSLPEQTADGEYILVAICSDNSTGIISKLHTLCNVSGLKTGLTSITNKEVYSTRDTIRILTNINNLDGIIENATLNLKIANSSWRSSTTLLFFENFSRACYPYSEWPPVGWRIDTYDIPPLPPGVLGNWRTNCYYGYSNSNSGAPEAQFYWYPVSENPTIQLITKAIDTTGYDKIKLEFDHYIADYAGNYSLKVESSETGSPGSWTSLLEWINLTDDLEATHEVTETSINVGGSMYLAFTFCCGNTYNIDYWYIDDIKVSGIEKPAVIWEKNESINLSVDEIVNLLTPVPKSPFENETGKYELMATLLSERGQVINYTESFFYITEFNTSLTMKTDKKIYLPNETINVSGKVTNHGDATESFNLKIFKDDVELYQDNFSLPSTKVYNYAFETSSETSFLLEGTIDNMSVRDFVEVEPPNVNISVIVPDIVGFNPFEVDVLVENIGNVTINFDLTIENHTWNIDLSPGETKLIKEIMKIQENKLLNVTFTGDINQIVQKEIIFGDKTRIDIDTLPTYVDGVIDIPYVINNLGLVDSRFNATFLINNQTILKNCYIPAGEYITDFLKINLSIGKYLLQYVSPFEEANCVINVLSPPEIVVNTILPYDKNFTLGQNVTFIFIIENAGGTAGFVNLKLFMPDYEYLNNTWVEPGEIKEITFDVVIPDDLEEKNYKGTYELNGVNYEFVYYVDGIKISVDAFLDKYLYEEGETSHLNLNITRDISTKVIAFDQDEGYSVDVKQVTGTVNDTDVNFQIETYDSIISGTYCILWLDTDQNQATGFSGYPGYGLNDIGADYRLTIYTSNQQAYLVRWTGSGFDYVLMLSVVLDESSINLSVPLVNLDDDGIMDFTLYMSYSQADIAPDEGHGTSGRDCPILRLFARVKLNDYNEIEYFNLTESATLLFDIPVSFTGQKIFYGIYMDTGRALYLNAVYVHKKEDNISLYTDKQVYNAGDNVSIYVESSQVGTLNLSAPGYNLNLTIDGSMILNFEIPELRTGTYYINYIFENNSYFYSFDVTGYSARVVESSLDKEFYYPTDVINASLTVDVNKDINGLLKIWIYDSAFNLIDNFELEKLFMEGENKIEFSTGFSTSFGGMHAFIYAFYAYSDIIFLASGSEYFDVILPNEAPIADIGGPYIGNESTDLTFNAEKSYDPDGDLLFYRWDFNNDGSWDTDYSINSTSSFTWNDDYMGTVVLEVSDGEFTDTDITSVNIKNVPPTVDAGFDQVVEVFDTVLFNGSFFDLGIFDTHDVIEWDFGDDMNASGSLNPDHVYNWIGSYVVTLNVTDDDGGMGTDTLTITVVDTIPPVTIKTIDQPKYGENDSWVASSTEFNLTAFDIGVGVNQTYYRVWYNGNWTTLMEYVGNFTLMSEGKHYLEYFSVDIAGNVEETHNQTHYIDDTPPYITVEVPSQWEALQDGVNLKSIVTDTDGCSVEWLKYSIRNPGGENGSIINSTFEALTPSYIDDNKWQMPFNTTLLPDGYYVLYVNASDHIGNEGYMTVNFSIRNWAVLEMLPNTPNNKAGRTMPVKFSLRVASAVDPNQPFVRNEELTILIYQDGYPETILLESTYGDTSTDYRINTTEEQYITNFKTSKTPMTYVVEIWRNDLLIGSFEFETFE